MIQVNLKRSGVFLHTKAKFTVNLKQNPRGVLQRAYNFPVAMKIYKTNKKL